MPYPEKENKKIDLVGIIGIIFYGSIVLLILFILWPFVFSTNAIKDSQQWGGYSPIAIYQVFDKETGVYYAITENGGICPMYTIEGKVKLVDQGNEYVIHKNLGELSAQE